MIKDKYFRERGGSAKIINVSCAKCKNKLFIYQKDGPGWLKRCYVNRILWPENYIILAKNKNLEPKELPLLKCSSCQEIIGSPMRHKDGRIAFSLIRGKFIRAANKSKSID